MKRYKNRKHRSASFGEIIFAVIVIAAIILTLGWFASNWKFETESVEEHFEKDELEEKKKKLTEVERRINELQLHKESIESRERRFFIGARTLIGIALVLFNIAYGFFYNNPFKLDTQLSINAAILLVYSFLAFDTYGTPNNLVQALKSKSGYYLKKKHIDVFIELEELNKERPLLILEIDQLVETKSINN